MYVCICEAVTEKDIQRTLDGGCNTVECVASSCGAGGSCGSCQGRIQRMIDARRGRRKSLRRVELPLAAK
jgi:bacterioferritin-associated ferredoxin